MIKGIGYQKVDINEEEFQYYSELCKEHGEGVFSDLFETDDEGIVTIIKPTKSIPWAVLFFVQNLMINQHLRQYDRRLAKLEKLGDLNE